MRIVNSFISDSNIKVPEYTAYALRKLREHNPDTPISFISNTGHGFDRVFEKYEVGWIDQNSLSSFYLDSFRGLSDLERHGTPNTKYPSPPKFFHRALERIFMLQAYSEMFEIDNIFHTENDVLTYYPINNLGIYCGVPDSPSIYITPMGPAISTFAVAYFDTAQSLKRLCAQFLEYLWMDERKFLALSGGDMLNEMTMLALADCDIDEIGAFEVLPSYTHQDLLCDPGSYGQYLGGTNNHDHGPGYAGDHHYIGAAINKKKIQPIFEGGKPYVIMDEKKIPLFNLHIHSKNLAAFL